MQTQLTSTTRHLQGFSQTMLSTQNQLKDQPPLSYRRCVGYYPTRFFMTLPLPFLPFYPLLVFLYIRSTSHTKS